jgi:resolvase-like protein
MAPPTEGGIMSDHPRAAGYCRVSTEEQAERGFSLGEQERKLREDAERRAEPWTRAYIDAGVSGRSTNRRTELAAMLAAAEGGEFEAPRHRPRPPSPATHYARITGSCRCRR